MEIEYKLVGELQRFKQNPKKHPQAQIEMIKKSMGEFGWTNPVLVAKDNIIVAGHARVEAAKQLGIEKVPTIPLDLEYEKAVAYVVADNRLAELAGDDEDLMNELLEDIRELDIDVEAVGFTEDELDDRLNEIMEEVEEEEPEMKISEELYEAHNYVVLYFDNEVDWQTAVDKLGIETVQTSDSREGYRRAGIGRVIRGVDVVRKL